MITRVILNELDKLGEQRSDRNEGVARAAPSFHQFDPPAPMQGATPSATRCRKHGGR